MEKVTSLVSLIVLLSNFSIILAYLGLYIDEFLQYRRLPTLGRLILIVMLTILAIVLPLLIYQVSLFGIAPVLN
jgi:hypothetical protein